MTTIPKIIHTTWVGTPMPPQVAAWIETWKRHHPDWSFMLWDDDAVFSREWMLQKHINHYRALKNWAGVADLVRLETLFMHGGFNAGADAECLAAIDELFEEQQADAFVSYENEQVRGGLLTPVLAATKGNDFVFALMRTLVLKEKVGEPWISTGNKFTTAMVEALEYPRLKIWPSHYLIPVHYTGVRYKGGGKIYAEHKWGSHGAYKEPKIYQNAVCRGAWALGTACGSCERCIDTKPI